MITVHIVDMSNDATFSILLFSGIFILQQVLGYLYSGAESENLHHTVYGYVLAEQILVFRTFRLTLIIHLLTP